MRTTVVSDGPFVFRTSAKINTELPITCIIDVIKLMATMELISQVNVLVGQLYLCHYWITHYLDNRYSTTDFDLWLLYLERNATEFILS